MKRSAYGFGIPALLAGLALAGGPLVAGKTLTIKEIMDQLHRGPNCLRADLGRGLRTGAPDWDAIHKETQEFVRLAEALRKNSPPLGPRDSWDQLTEVFLDNARALDSAAQQHDKAAALRAHARLGNCKTCHDAHKPK